MGLAQKCPDVFEPFFGGIFLENELRTSRRMFDFVFKMFGEAAAAIPARGMEEIPKQLASQLNRGSLILQKQVTSIEHYRVHTAQGDAFSARAILLATEAPGLVQNYQVPKPEPGRRVSCVYFQADQSPLRKAMIILNAHTPKLVNNLCVMSEVSTEYAPPGKALISASFNGSSHLSDGDLSAQIRNEFSKWFGDQVFGWRLLKRYQIDYALPNQDSVKHHSPANAYRINEGLYRCGDYLLNGSINAAMKSGRNVADLIAEDLK
ncbi:MAG: FAD-dependent oxidoreductase [Bacteroidia bacterium]|nr:FAD-dependent oxidoreductase [Bacteroidia bacterium]